MLFRFLAGSMLAVLMWISNGFYIVFEIKAMLRVVLGIVAWTALESGPRDIESGLSLFLLMIVFGTERLRWS